MKYKDRSLQISCDGGAATGKSTGAKMIAKKYKLKFLSSGLLYRYASYLVLRFKPKNKLQFLRVKFKKLDYGRLEKINLPDNEYAKEFFYGYHHFKQLQHDVDIVEFSEKKSFLNWIYYILNKLSDLPIYGQYLVSKSNYKKLRNADEVILTNQKTAFSMLPLLVFINLNH